MGGIREIIDGSRAFIAYKGHNSICWKCYTKLDKEQPMLPPIIMDKAGVLSKEAQISAQILAKEGA